MIYKLQVNYRRGYSSPKHIHKTHTYTYTWLLMMLNQFSWTLSFEQDLLSSSSRSSIWALLIVLPFLFFLFEKEREKSILYSCLLIILFRLPFVPFYSFWQTTTKKVAIGEWIWYNIDWSRLVLFVIAFNNNWLKQTLLMHCWLHLNYTKGLKV